MTHDNHPSRGAPMPGEHSGRFEHPDDLVERLLGLADNGPVIPEGGAERIKAAVRPVWQREVQRRNRRAWLWQGAVAVAVTAVIGVALAQWLDLWGGGSPEPVAVVVRTVGHLAVETPTGETHALGPSEKLAAGVWLRSDHDSRAVLELAGGQQLRVDTNTWVQLDGARRLHLSHGAVYVDSGAVANGAVEVVTDLGVARDIGTRFELRRQDGALVVRVRDGRVELERAAGDHEVPAGVELTVDAAGAISERQIRADGSEWSWTLAVAPSFELEGETVASFMRWVVSETGHDLRFATPELEAAAAETVLHGDLGGLTPDEAPAVVLPSCGLAVQEVAGAMIVTGADPNRG